MSIRTAEAEAINAPTDLSTVTSYGMTLDIDAPVKLAATIPVKNDTTNNNHRLNIGKSRVDTTKTTAPENAPIIQLVSNPEAMPM